MVPSKIWYKNTSASLILLMQGDTDELFSTTLRGATGDERSLTSKHFFCRLQHSPFCGFRVKIEPTLSFRTSRIMCYYICWGECQAARTNNMPWSMLHLSALLLTTAAITSRRETVIRTVIGLIITINPSGDLANIWSHPSDLSLLTDDMLVDTLRPSLCFSTDSLPKKNPRFRSTYRAAPVQSSYWLTELAPPCRRWFAPHPNPKSRAQITLQCLNTASSPARYLSNFVLYSIFRNISSSDRRCHPECMYEKSRARGSTMRYIRR